MNEYYYDLTDHELKDYYNSLTNKNATPEHIREVEKELEVRGVWS